MKMIQASEQTNSLRLIKPHKGGQRAIYRHPARFHVVSCGRRFGKTAFGKLVAAQTLFGYGLDVWWVSPTYKMASHIWREFKNAFGQFAEFSNSSERQMGFYNGAVLTFWTGDAADTMRGGSPGVVIVDEAAMIRDVNMWPAVIRPALSDHRGRAMFLSTPKGHNWFWELFNRGNDPLFPDYKSWTFPTVNNYTIKHIVPEVEEARLSLSDRLFRQEYLAEFIPDAGGVFRGVLDVSTLEIPEPYEGDFCMGVDWAKENDFTVVSVFDRQKKKQVDIDRFNKVDWTLQRGRLVAMYDRWKPRVIWAEANSIGGPNIEALQREGLPMQPFTTSATTKPPLIEAFALAIERKDVGLLNDRVQIAELQAYQMERRSDGKFKYNAPDGGHDDTVISGALGWYGIINSPSMLIEGFEY